MDIAAHQLRRERRDVIDGAVSYRTSHPPHVVW
jgi:hypothetical protein